LIGLGWAAVATIARAAVGPFVPSGPPLAFVFAVVLISTLQTGWAGGIVTLFAYEAAAWQLYIPGLRITALGLMSAAERLTITFLISLVLIVIASRYRVFARRAAEAEKAAARAREEAYQEHADRLRLLVHEVDHRANNLMAVIQGLVTLSNADDAAGLKKVIEGRLHALAKAHKLMSEARWRGADLDRLAAEELAPYGLGSGGRITVAGENVALSSAAAQGMALALHELATNAVKYGALSNDAGQVRVTWSVSGGVLSLSWEESGGPAVEKPRRRGTGLRVLERAFEGALGGSTRLDWSPGGLHCRLQAPIEPDRAPGREPAAMVLEAVPSA
jgi:two-component sensor histidine kinase